MFFRELEYDFIERIVNDKFYNKIINHRNYTPRLIEFFTDKRRVEHVKLEAFRDFITYNLDHPEEIWTSAIDNQIDYLDRCLLYTLFTFRVTPMVADLRRSFDKRLNYEIEFNNQKIKTNQFDESVRNLLNGFIYIKMTNVDYRFEYIRFINPSIADFIMGDLKTNEKEKEAILNSMIFVEQLEIFDKSKTDIHLSKEGQSILLDKITSNLLESYYPWNKPIEIFYLGALVKYCKDVDYDDVFVSNFHNLSLEEPIEHSIELIYALQNIHNAPKSIETIKTNFYSIIGSLIQSIDEQNFALLIPDLFIQFGFNYEEYINGDKGNKGMIDLIFRIVEKSENKIYESIKGQLSNLDDLDALVYQELDDSKSVLIEKLDPKLVIDIPIQLLYENIELQITINQKNETEADKRIQELQLYSENIVQNEDNKIENLFYMEHLKDSEIDELPF